MGRDAAGLKGPGLERGTGALPVLGGVSPVEAEAAAARGSRPEAAVGILVGIAEWSTGLRHRGKPCRELWHEETWVVTPV